MKNAETPIDRERISCVENHCSIAHVSHPEPLSGGPIEICSPDPCPAPSVFVGACAGVTDHVHVPGDPGGRLGVSSSSSSIRTHAQPFMMWGVWRVRWRKRTMDKWRHGRTYDVSVLTLAGVPCLSGGRCAGVSLSL